MSSEEGTVIHVLGLLDSRDESVAFELESIKPTLSSLELECSTGKTRSGTGANAVAIVCARDDPRTVVVVERAVDDRGGGLTHKSG